MPLDFPHTIVEFASRFGTEEAAWQYLRRSRWPQGFVCPLDGKEGGGFISTRKVWKCHNGHQVSVTAGTVLHGTQLPLTKWFWAAYLVTTQTPGISAWQLHRQLNLRYETAYMMLQKLRAGMVNPGRTPLHGVVEVDETYIGGKKAGLGGRGARGKALVVAAVEVVGQRAGRVRLRKIPHASSEHLLAFLRAHVAPGSTVITDGWQGYAPLSRFGYRHIVREGETSKEVAKQLPHVHRVFGNLKAWLIGTHHGVSPKHLQAYLNEYTFRFNRRAKPMAAFQRILGISAIVAGPTYRALYRVGKDGWRHPNILWPGERSG